MSILAAITGPVSQPQALSHHALLAIGRLCHLSSQTSSMRHPLKMLLTIRVSPLTCGCRHRPTKAASPRETDSPLEQEGFELVVPPRKGVAISSPTRRAGGPPGWL